MLLLHSFAELTNCLASGSGESIILLNRMSSGNQGGKKRRDNLSNISKDTNNSTSSTTQATPVLELIAFRSISSQFH